MTNNQRFGYAFGAFFLLVGLAGLIATWGAEATTSSGGRHPIILGANPCPFALNPLHSLIHLGGGAALLIGATRGDRVAHTINKTMAATYLLLGSAGSVLVAMGVDIVVMHDALVYLAMGTLALTGAMKASVPPPGPRRLEFNQAARS